jgi:hypothetical protein
MSVPFQPIDVDQTNRLGAASARERRALGTIGALRSLALAALMSSMTRLAIGVAVLAATWLLVMPAVSRQAPLRRVIDRNQAHGVNANAMYYTELEGVRFLDLRGSSPNR